VRYKAHDIAINELFRKYCDEPVMVLVDVEQSDEMKLPTQGFISVQEVDAEGTMIRTFKHVSCTVEAFEAEEVGVEHLMRDVENLNLDSIEENIS
jgi:26S proteasome regulatory subunit N8